MQAIQIELNKSGHEPFLDFLKAYAIICVLIGHTFPYLNDVGAPLWLEMQVPIFILIQAFHVLKKPSSKLGLKKMFFRILLPYLVVLLGIIIVYLCFGKMDKEMISKGLVGGGVWSRLLLSLDLYTVGYNIVFCPSII